MKQRSFHLISTALLTAALAACGSETPRSPRPTATPSVAPSAPTAPSEPSGAVVPVVLDSGVRSALTAAPVVPPSPATVANATAPAFMGRQDAEQRLMSEGAVKAIVREQMQSGHTPPTVQEVRSPVGGCTRGSDACQWIFSITRRMAGDRTEVLYFKVDPFTGAIQQGNPTSNHWTAVTPV